MKIRRKKKIHCITAEFERCYIFLTILVGFGFLIMMFSSMALLIYRTGKEDDGIQNLIGLIVIDIVLIISCFDIFCCPFCSERVKLMWWARKNRGNSRQKSRHSHGSGKNYNERTNYDLTETLLTPNSSKQSKHIPFNQL